MMKKMSQAIITNNKFTKRKIKVLNQSIPQNFQNTFKINKKNTKKYKKRRSASKSKSTNINWKMIPI